MRYPIMILFSLFMTTVYANSTLPWLHINNTKSSLLSNVKDKDSLKNAVAVYLNNPANLSVLLSVTDITKNNNVAVSQKQAFIPLPINAFADQNNYFNFNKLSSVINPVTGLPANGCHYLYDANDKMHNQLGNDIVFQISATACTLTMVPYPARTQCGDDGLPYDPKSMNCVILDNSGLVPLQGSVEASASIKTNVNATSGQIPVTMFAGADENNISVQVVSIDNQSVKNCSVNNKAVGQMTFTVAKDLTGAIHCIAAYDPTPPSFPNMR